MQTHNDVTASEITECEHTMNIKNYHCLISLYYIFSAIKQ